MTRSAAEILQEFIDAVDMGHEHGMGIKWYDDAKLALAAEGRGKLTDFERAIWALRANVPNLPTGFEFELPQAVGISWESLDMGSRLAMGKHLKSNAANYGLEVVKRSTSNHLIYRRKTA